jgi:hypothetical protein
VASEADNSILERYRHTFRAPVSWNPVNLLPEFLYHYTTAAGLCGIVADGAIRATNFSFLNDLSEVEHGRRVADQVLKVKRQRSSAAARQLTDRIIASFNVETVSEVYVACFTTLADDLSQWRAYGGSIAERYALGFDAHALDLVGGALPNGRFARVLYDEAEQRARLKRVLAKAFAFVEGQHLLPAALDVVAAETAKRMARVLPVFKNDAYKREEEWRVILWQSPDDETPQFDTSRGVLRPYRPFILGRTIRLRQLYVMAPARREIALKAAKMLLRAAAVENPECFDSSECFHSSIPFAE